MNRLSSLQGFDFERAVLAEIEAFRQLARDFNVEMWMSAITARDRRHR